jgi:SSS family solute:Na+ symporter
MADIEGDGSPQTVHYLPGGASVAVVELSWFDILTLIAYFLLLGGMSFVISRHMRDRQEVKASSEAFFLAERSVSWWAVAASLFASNIGTEHFVGLAGSAAKDGISVAWYEIGAIPVILLLGFVLLPTYLNAQIMTMPDYLEQRYSVRCRQVVVVLSLCLYVFTKVSATLFAGQIIVVELLDMNPYLAVILLVIFTSAYTVTGGLEAVIYTEVMQTVILVIGGLMVLGFTLRESGGMAGIRAELPESYFHLFRPATDETYPWTGFIFGYYCVSIWYW